VSGSTTTISIGSAVSGATTVTNISGNLTTTGTSHSIANSTEAQTVSIGAGSTISGATKAINIGANGVSGSTTNITLGSNLSSGTLTIQSAGTVTVTGTTTCSINGATINVGSANVNTTVGVGAGSMSSGVTKTVNIGTGGVAGATVNVNIGSTSGTSTTTFNGIVNANGLANGVKAWVNFNGTGTVAIRASFNVTSITDNGVGDYTVNFTTALADVNYCTVVTPMRVASNTGAQGFLLETTTPTAALVRVGTANQGGTLVDSTFVNVAIIR
jgi:hypothetical protein